MAAPKKKVKKVVEKITCRKCEKELALSNYYQTTNPFLDSNGYCSICKGCCNDIYDHYFSIYGDLRNAIHATCQDLDVRFTDMALEQTQSHIERLLSTGKEANAVFGYYKSKISSLSGNNEGIQNFRYRDSDIAKKEGTYDIGFVEDKDMNSDEDSILFWGEGFTERQISFLNLELSNWQKTHKCDNQAEITLLKEICIKILGIRDKRANDENTNQDIKELQDLFKTASVDPAKANAASAGKSHEAFGLWIKEIEELTPAEWYEDQLKYKDMDGFAQYIKNYVVRPIRNFLSGTRNFKVDDNIDSNLEGGDSDG